MSSVKQVIVIRKDLKMRRGKEIAQGAHASMAVILNEMHSRLQEDDIFAFENKCLSLDADLSEWLNGNFTKICLVVNSEEELLNLHAKAKDANLRTVLIEDSGKTEFKGVPTYTTCAIGPNRSDKIDDITSHLKLY